MAERIRPKPHVCRQLFPPATNEESASNENYMNNKREEDDRELREKSHKWHYDFKNDAVMPGKGNVKWDYNEEGILVGVLQNRDEADTEETLAIPEENRDELTYEVIAENETKNDRPEPNSNDDVVVDNCDEISNETNEIDDKEEAIFNEKGLFTPVKSPPKKRAKVSTIKKPFSDKSD